MHFITNLVILIVVCTFFVFCDYNPHEKPFRMQKLNLVWEKASKKLPKEKMKLLLTDLKYQDKEEINLKKVKAEGLDKKGLKEATVKASFTSILQKYNLQSDFQNLEESISEKIDFESPNEETKYVFRDKKLNKLWLKAEQQGFSEDYLQMLKEEFQDHQNNIDHYYKLMDDAHKSSYKEDSTNTLNHVVETEGDFREKKVKEEISPHQLLKEKHSELKVNYDQLSGKIVTGSKYMEFEEPQVNALWEMAKNASFTGGELESLRGELHHFEHRIKKYRHLSEQHLRAGDENNIVDAELIKRQKKIKEYERKVDKIKMELEDRISQRHTEL